MNSVEWQVVGFTLRIALAATALLIVPGTFFAWLLARRDWRGKSIVETAINLPLVMPPVATGLILLQLFGRHGAAGSLLHEAFGIDVVFTWRAVVLAMSVMAFPLFVRTSRVAFEQVDHRLEDIARTLGAREPRTFFSVTLPLAMPGVIAGAVIAFARALGEFGATILVAGNIPGRTTTLSVAIYNLVQLGKDRTAMHLLAIAVAVAFVALWISEILLRRLRRQ